MLIRSTAACGALVALALTGCGSSGNSTATSLSKSEFVSQADAICAKINSARQSLGSPTSTAQVVSALTKLESAVQPDLTQMKSLAAQAPSDVKADYDQFVAKVGSLVGLLPGLAQAAKSNDLAKVQQLEVQFQTAVNQGKAAAKRAGLGTACTT